MNSKKYGQRHAKYKMTSQRIIDSFRDNTLNKRVGEHGNVGNNDISYENCDNILEQNSNHDGCPALPKTATTTITNRNLLLTNAYGDNINTTNEHSKLKINNISESTDNFHLNPMDTQYVSCSRNVQNNPLNNQSVTRFDENSYERRSSSFLQGNNDSKTSTSMKTCADKVTYCRPVHNFYNQEFVYKNMTRNARLQQLLRKIICVRQREKEQERWNNFINELKNKYESRTNQPNNPTSSSLQGSVRPDIIDDYYNTRFQWRQSNQCQNLLEDFYGAYKINHPDAFYKPNDYGDPPQSSSYRPCIYENHPYCYPTSSQARLMMYNRERGINKFNDNCRSYPPSRYYHGNTIIADSGRGIGSTSNKTFIKSQPIKYPFISINKGLLIKNTAIQTESKCLHQLNGEEVSDEVKEETTKQKCDRVSKNVERLKKKIETSHNDDKSKSLVIIENKLNDLIQSINALLLEIKTNNEFKKSIIPTSVSCQFNDSYVRRLNGTKSDTYKVFQTERIVCGMAHNTSRSTLTIKDVGSSKEKYNKSYMSEIDDILYEELDKSNRVKTDIEDIINKHSNRPCAVKITFDIPTRERATEVTASLSKPRLNVDKMMVVEEIGNPNAGRMTIAVNTDPLGLLALLKISTETVKQILSYMPHIDYFSYLPMIQFPQSSRCGVSHYVCSICGAAFGRPSQLNDHIQEHNLGNSRDCCVCRQVLNKKRHRPGLFSCQYCGQKFTRAYCCQLHEEPCAKRLGARHDVTPSLMLLR